MTHTSFGDTRALYEHLLGYVNVERGQETDFRLDRMRWLASRLGDPQNLYPVVHVAGSKGKGSVSTMIAGILAAAGFRTGLYTSPHLVHWDERIRLADAGMPPGILVESGNEVLATLHGYTDTGAFPFEPPTFFELTTLIAFLAFRKSGCTAVVLETGLGGRLDATNIVTPVVSVITPIELEHTEILGDTVEKIAAEKAGILKPGIPVCVSPQTPEAMGVFRRVARERGCTLYALDDLGRCEDTVVDREGTRTRFAIPDIGAYPALRQIRRDGTTGENGRETSGRAGESRETGGSAGPGSADPASPRAVEIQMDLYCPMHGKIQAQNMALASIAACVGFDAVTLRDISTGLAGSFLEARFQSLGLSPEVVLDGAHTPASMALTVETFIQLYGAGGILVFGCASDKNHARMAGLLSPAFSGIVVTRPGTFKKSDPEAVLASFAATGHGDVVLVDDTVEAIAQARKRSLLSGKPVLVTGSFYLCSAALVYFRRSGTGNSAQDLCMHRGRRLSR